MIGSYNIIVLEFIAFSKFEISELFMARTFDRIFTSFIGEQGLDSFEYIL